MKRTFRERVFDWAFPSGAVAVGAALALIAYGRGVGVGEARAEAVKSRVDTIETRTMGDHDILTRVDVRTAAMEKQLETIGDVAKLAAEIAAFRKWIEEAKAEAGLAPRTSNGGPAK